VETRALIDRCQAVIRKKDRDRLDPWIADAEGGLVASIAMGAQRDKSAARAAIMEPWSDSQVKGQIAKLKLVKRQMYGRANLDLLQARSPRAA
jgi:transposase